MTSRYNYDEEKYSSSHARRSHAGSLRPSRIGGNSPSGPPQPPQAIIKVAGWANAPSSVKRMLDYIGRNEDKPGQEHVALETEDGVQRKGEAEVKEIYDEWKKDFQRKSPQAKSKPRHAAHLVLSAGAELKSQNVRKTLRAARKTVEKHFGEAGYKYALGVHQDGNYPHVHVLVNTVSIEKGGHKLRLGPGQLLEVRKSFAEELTREGLEHVATREPAKRKKRHSNLKKPQPDTLAKVKKIIDRMTKEQRQFERTLSREKPSVNTVKHRSQQDKALNTLRGQVKADDKLVGQNRLEAFNLIRSFSRGVEKKGINAEVEATSMVNHFEKRLTKWMKGVEKVTPSKNKKSLPQHLAKVGKDIQRELDQFLRQDLRGLAISVDVKKAIHKQLRPQALALLKAQERTITRGR